MICHKSMHRFIFILIATFAILLSLPHPALAEPAKKLTEDEIFYQQSYLMLSTKKYKELDQRFQKYLDLYARNELTAEDLSLKFDTFAKTPGLEPRYDEWVKAFPESYSARLARGIYRVTTAWEKRGSGLARNTTDSQFRGFGETLKDAQSDLLLSLKLYARPVDSYRFLIRVSKGLGLDDERDLLDAALKLDPKALDPRFEYLDAITPKWSGDEDLMARFLEESNQSQMSDKNKKVIEGKYFYSLGEQARFGKDFKTAADNFYKYYLTNHNPANLQMSGQALLDGDFKDLAFERFSELVKDHPKYCYGYELRGYLYEYHFKDIEKSVADYLAAADLGANWSQNRMGWYYMMGINVPVDYAKAKHYLDLAAAQGNNTAKENLVILKQLPGYSDKTPTTEAERPN
jgi:TPR repeat protein